MDIKAAFGSVLKELRTEKGLSQETLALEAGLDRSYVSKLETGVYQPSLSTLFAICEVLGVRPGNMVERVERRMP